MIDKYDLNARLYPMVLFYMPILLLGILFSFEFDKYMHLLTGFGIIGALSYLVKQFGRDAGEIKEQALWASWGGPPCAQLLRWRNTVINVNTKKRYHDKLQALCPVDVRPDPDFENTRPAEADSVYDAWTKFLISKTRDKKKYTLLFIENMNYGFRRNLWGLKTYALSLLSALMILTYLYYAITTKNYSPRDFSVLFIIAQTGLALLVCFWSFFVNAKWVKVPAFAFAERLLESMENLKKEKN